MMTYNLSGSLLITEFIYENGILVFLKELIINRDILEHIKSKNYSCLIFLFNPSPFMMFEKTKFNSC